MRKNGKKNKKNKVINLFSNQKGIALLTTLIFIFILVTFGVALLSMTSNDIKLSALQRDSTKAFYIAESGIEKALWNLNTTVLKGGKGFEWRPGDTDPLFHEGTTTEYYDVTVGTVQNPTATLPEIIKITSTGVVKPDGVKTSGKRTIEVKAIKGILPSDDLFYEYAIATDTSMVLQGNIAITGNIHSNGTIGVAGVAYTLNGNSSAVVSNDAVGENGLNPSGPEYYDEHPQVDFDFYKNLSTDPMYDDYGGETYVPPGGTKYFNTDGQVIKGIHFIVGNVEISANTNLIISGGAIFATGTITSKGNAGITHERRLENIHTVPPTIIDCTDLSQPCPPACGCDPDDPLYNPSYDPDSQYYDPLCNNPFALVAKGDITLGGTINTQGIIQTEATFTSNGNINVEPGAIYADEGVFHGGGGVMNVVWDESLIGTTIPGTGEPYYLIISWQEV